MGCTASAPNTLPLNANTADKSIQFEEETNEYPSIEVDVGDIEEDNEPRETKVLPSCDNTEEPVQLVRNNKSTNSLDNEKANGHVIESENVSEATTKPPDDVKIPKLELFMEKVFESNHHLNDGDHKLSDKMKSDVENSTVEVTEQAESILNNAEKEEVENEAESNDNETAKDHKNENEQETEEASPSQSQSSRATRWEALADIAAELPPSLAVDPITGQIYQIAQPKRQADQNM